MSRVGVCRWASVLAVGGIALGRPSEARANPNEGEARSITRDADRPYTVVAGEADGASTVVNPANLGYLRGINAVLDFSWTAASALRRGSGVGAFLGIPLPFQIASIGLGYQFFYPVQPEQGGSSNNQPQNQDDPYSKITLALAVPFERWVPGLSLGFGYSRLLSSRNFHADGVNQFDVALSYWANRFLALGVVGRAINVPQTGPGDTVQPFIIDPELAVRPFGTRVLELAAGVRYAPRVPSDQERFAPWHVQPRGRIMLTVGSPAQPWALRLFAEAERYKHLPDDLSAGADPRNAVRITGGVEVVFPHVGLAGGITTSAGGRDSFAADGGVARLRVSQERYEGVVVAPRRVTKVPLSEYGGERGTWRLIELLDDAARRSDVVVLETRGMPHGFAQVEEIREAVTRLRLRGGKVAVYMEGGALRHYFLATAADRILVHPARSLSVLGMRIQTFYFAELLAKLGAKAEFVRIAQYKGAPEQWERTTASQPVKTQRQMYVSDTWNHVLRIIARERGHDPLVVKRWIDEAPIQPDLALREGIVDELAFPDELDERLEAWLGRKVRIAKPSQEKMHRHDFGPPTRIAVVLVEGDLLSSESFTIPLLGRKIAGSYTLTKTVESLRKDPGVEAIVVRIDSPGGEVAAAEAIARELDLARREKPVVISMSSQCASGGYYIATAGQYIFTDATTLTGSIGIFYPKMDLTGTLEKFGVGVDRYEFGQHAGMRSSFKAYSEDEREAAMRDIRASYELFTARVARARSMSPEVVDSVARGRIWSGVRATEIGLADGYGGVREAVLRARAIAGLRPGEGEVVFYPEPPGLLETIRRVLGVRLPSPLGTGRDLVAAGSAVAQPLGLGAGLGLMGPLVAVLRHLPTSLWLADGPVPLALAEEAIVIGD